MNLSQDIHPLTDFKRKTSDFLRQLKETGNPLVLTINGNAELVVQDAASYQRLFDLAEWLETVQAVRESIISADRGDGRPMDDTFDAIEKDLRRSKARQSRDTVHVLTVRHSAQRSLADEMAEGEADD